VRGEGKILNSISSPEDVKKLSQQELEELSAEIRKLIIETVSETGGHLASNLGAVEITLALHKVFDFSKDKLILDVSHQVYTHKIITGRKEKFFTLRQYKGISGYANPEESEYDAFVAGHAATSLALAVGFVEARKIKKENHEIVVVIGDGAFTAGEAFEGLNNLGRLGEKVIIILNDNEMSISKNVGALSQYFARIRTSSFYRTIKAKLPKTTFGRRIKLAIKDLILPVVFFEEFGFTYLGPVDGHNVESLVSMLKRSKNINSPVVVHVITKKGKGYKPAEENPTAFHSAHPFDIRTGKFRHPDSKLKSFSEVFGEEIVRLGEEDKRLFAITAAMPDGTKTSLFRDKFPDRFLDVGIAEQCAVTAGAALAKEGLKPVVAIYSTFMQRAYDQLVHDVGILDLPVIFALDRAGVVSQDGPTHQGVFDLSFMRTIPNFVVMAPKNASELRAMLKFALDCKHPVSIRYPKDYAEEGEEVKKIEIGKAELVKSGKDLLIISIGVMFYPAAEAVKILENKGISVGLINARFVKPIDKDLITREALRSGKVLTVEDNTLSGGFGSVVKEILSDKDIIVHSLGINDFFPEQGNRKDLLAKYGLNAETIAKVGEKIAEEKIR
jgi:1-deoxy-D-xylulose-5-phosphate synthase